MKQFIICYILNCIWLFVNEYNAQISVTVRFLKMKSWGILRKKKKTGKIMYFKFSICWICDLFIVKFLGNII